jgi:hypothetical protein
MLRGSRFRRAAFHEPVKQKSLYFYRLLSSGSPCQTLMGKFSENEAKMGRVCSVTVANLIGKKEKKKRLIY